ncbi:type II CRISPR RNA-guided endonuclease Cas9 [Flavobacterium sp. GA093]|uniref:CRISPR-associated endonuclease Cas9 n=1 Tax=Flavobacterium hydrocarbonoxydans TaxID=2683249 RepID=A0A6I4NPE0_9FLAO|nr:type II CRISPR RNA-guided endonuclease Cas9 [Flavobacterium hydrocarbonoxydans]MWB93074.1 type II CRISPR RNA-guided endonuclease Cas9 [Flavobacterium hydrocarbonoxydans]
MKKIIGIDLSTTSIGWAFIEEAQSTNEISSIINTGVRVVPITNAEQTDFKKGNSISTNSQRTLRRGARRNLQRFKLRREALLGMFKKIKFIPDNFVYAEKGPFSTFSTYELRAKAALEMVTKEDLVRVLMMLNKKRGYNAKRAFGITDQTFPIGEAGRNSIFSQSNMAKEYENYSSTAQGRQIMTSLYDSDLQNELDAIVSFQQQFHPQCINFGVLEEIRGKSKILTTQYFKDNKKIDIEQFGDAVQTLKMQFYKWRKEATEVELDLKTVVYIIAEINHQIHQMDIFYLNAIGNGSKELFLNKETVGQFLLRQLQYNPHAKLKNQVFCRQDYLNEFNLIWKTQAKFYPELDERLQREVGDRIIFYQRKLKSKKHTIGQCDLEKGHKVIPKSSPLHQEFQVWKSINAIVIHNAKGGQPVGLSLPSKFQLAKELLFKDSYCEKHLTKFCRLATGGNGHFLRKVTGNRTNCEFYRVFMQILLLEGYDLSQLLKLNPSDLTQILYKAFLHLGINTRLLEFDSGITGNDFDKQPYYQLWHLLYSAEDEKTLKKTLVSKFGFTESHIVLLLGVKLEQGYGSLSARAIKKILPYLKQGYPYDQALLRAGYGTAESELFSSDHNGALKQKIAELKRSEVRNPVMGKVLNQLIHIINAICADPAMGPPDEVRIAIAGELKNSREKRARFSRLVDKNRNEHHRIKKILKEKLALDLVTRDEITRYKLWEECKGISFYTGRAIDLSLLYTPAYAIGSIIPEACLFDDRFSNKIIGEDQFIKEQAMHTVYSFLEGKLLSGEFDQFQERVKMILGVSSAEKCRKLLLRNDEIPEVFIDQQLIANQYMISRIKKQISGVCHHLTFTTGSITDKLRRDWGLVDVLKEINWDRYNTLGLTQKEKGSNGVYLTKIKHWKNLSDYRYSALNAIIIAFTNMLYIESLKRLNSKGQGVNREHSFTVMESKYMLKEKEGRVYFESPMEDFKNEVINKLEGVLISYKIKNIVVARSRNFIKTKYGIQTKIQFNPRGPLHKETVYGGLRQYAVKEMKVNVNFIPKTISKVAKKEYREILMQRLLENDNDTKKAFTGKNAVSRNPIYLDVEKNKPMPERVKLVWLEPLYSIRKVITPGLKIDKIIDKGIKSLLIERLNEYGGDFQKALGNLDENPLWLNKEKGICIKRVALRGAANTKALHFKRDHLGNKILDEEGNSIPNDFISTGNNHHLALYRDSLGNLHDEVISFFDIVLRYTEGLPLVKTKHENGWDLVTSIRHNELFVFPSEDFVPWEIDLYDPRNRKKISENLFRAQKFSKSENAGGCIRDYVFRHHLESEIKDVKILKDKTYKMIKSLSAFNQIVKIRLNHLGQVVQVGEGEVEK